MFIDEDEKFFINKSSIDGVGLCVKKSYKKGDFIAHIDGEKVVIKKFSPSLTKTGWNWIGTSKYTWINTDRSPFRFINHSCDPNVAIKGERTVYAIRSLKAGQEIMMDYSLTECQNEWFIPKCKCGSHNCRKVIKALQFLSKQDFLAKKNIIPKHFQKIFIHSTVKK